MPRQRWVLLATLLFGCDCGGGDVLGRVEPTIEYSPTELDFGEVAVGWTKRLTVRISNQGSADLILGNPDAMSPFFVRHGSLTVRPGDQVVLDVGFRPINDEPQASSLSFTTNVPNRPTESVRLSGKGVAGSVNLRPPTVDFSETSVGAQRGAELVLDNLGLAPISGRLVTEGFDRPEHWALSTLTTFDQPVNFGVEARRQVIYDLNYRPLAVGPDPGVIRFELCGERCGLEVEVTASASQPSLVLEPPALDFGDQGIGESRTQQLVARNTGSEPIEVRDIRRAGGAEWEATPPRGLPFTLAPGDAAAINVTFTPSSAVESTAEVVVISSDPTSPEIRASLIGRGAGPRFEVLPNPINFGVERAAGNYRRGILLVNSGSSEVRVLTVGYTGAAELGLAPLPGLPARLGRGESLPLEVLFNPTQVGEYRGTISITTDDPASSNVEVPVTGGMADSTCEITVAPERITFGALPVGHSRRRSAVISNVGNSLCTFLSGSFRVPVDPAFSVVGTPWPAALAPGQSLTIELEYAPVSRVESKGNLTLLTDDLVFPERHLSLSGTAKQDSRIFVAPPMLDFGGLAVGCAASRQFTSLYNLGTTSANVASVTLTGSPDFQLVIGPPLPATVVSGATFPVGVDYLTNDAGDDLGEIEIVVPEALYTFVVPLRGRGLVNQNTTDVYSQSRNDKVDVLFVVDDSCSMGDDQVALATNFSNFIQQASLRSVDFQIGVTTTTTFPSAGTLRGPVLKASTPSLEANFAVQVNVGTSGSGIEQGLEAMAGALSLADQGVSPNAQLFRADATLVVVIVSDEDDSSPALETFYFGEIHNRYSGRGYLTAAVTGEASGCFDAQGGSAASAPRYLSFLSLTGGISESICSDWATTLASIGNAVFGLRNVFVLSSAADQTVPIIVTVNGVPAPAGSWTYDPTRKAVVFGTAPSDGATITIEYRPTC